MGVARQQKEIAQNAAGTIGEFIEHRVAELILVSEIERFWEMRMADHKRALYRLLKHDPQIREVSVANSAGQEILRLSRLRVHTDADLVSLAQEEKFRRAMNGEIYIGPVYHEVTAEPFVTLAVPVRFTPTEIRGVIVAEVGLKALLNSVSHTKAGKSGYLFVVDRKGTLIAHPDYSKVLLQLNLSQINEVEEFLRTPGSDPGFGEVHRGVDGKQVITTHAAVPRPNWAVVVEEPVETALAEVKQVERVALLMLVLALSGVFGISYFFSERIARPVRALEHGASLIAQGVLDQKLDIHTGDELESLARQFNQMAAALKESREGLEGKIAERTRDLSELYGALAPLGSSGPGQSLQNVVERLKEVTHADAALIRIVDQEKKYFLYSAHVGFPSSYLEATQTLQPGSAVGTAIMTGEPIVAADITEDLRIVGKRQLDAGFRSCAFLPFRVSGELRGIIHLASREIGYFNEQKSDHLMTIAYHMGVAVENRELFEETRCNLQRIRGLHEIEEAVASTLDLHAVLGILLEKIEILLPYPVAATVRLKKRETGVLEPLACRGLNEEEWRTQHGRSLGGRAKKAVETKIPLTVRNVQTDPQTSNAEIFRKYGLVSHLAVPLIAKNETIGVLGLYTREEHEFANEEIEFLSTLAAQAAIAIHNSQLYEQARTRESQLQETNRMLSALHAVAAVASQSLELDRVLNTAIEKITEIFGFDATRIHLCNEQTDEILLRASFETEPDRFTAARSFKRGQGVLGEVAKSGKPLVFEDVDTDPLYHQFSQTGLSAQFGYHFLAVFPIKGKLTNLGTLSCIGTAPRKLNSGEVQLLEALADQIAVVIENSVLYEHVRQKAEELQQRTEELERADKVKDEFLSVMSHELRTPLNVVMGYTAMIKDGMFGETNPEQMSALEKVLDQANDLLAMITSILYATSVETHEVRTEPHRFALGDFLDGLRTAYDSSRGKALTLVWNYSPDLPAVETDSEKLKYILQNLIHNAIKFTDSGQVTVSARIRGGRGQAITDGDQQPANGKEEELIEFKVADTGIGISQEKLPLIFEKFHQIDSSDTRPYGGIGLGLYVAKNFTELLGGKIELETEQGKGSTFTVNIPCVIGSAATDGNQEKEQQVLGLQDLTNPLPLDLGLRSEGI